MSYEIIIFIIFSLLILGVPLIYLSIWEKGYRQAQEDISVVTRKMSNRDWTMPAKQALEVMADAIDDQLKHPKGARK